MVAIKTKSTAWTVALLSTRKKHIMAVLANDIIEGIFKNIPMHPLEF